MIIKENVLTAEDFLRLYESVGWAAPLVRQIRLAIEHSICTFSLYHCEELVGMARLIGGKGMSFYFKDFVILPENRGKGYGRMGRSRNVPNDTQALMSLISPFSGS